LLKVVVCVLAACAPAPAQQVKAVPKSSSPSDTKKLAGDRPHALEGSWRMMKSLDPRTRQMAEMPAGIEMTKLVVGGRWAWVIIREGQILAAAGGTYKVSPTGYAETCTYAAGQNQQALIGSTTSFTWKLVDGKWHHKGTIRIGQQQQEIDEIWERTP